MWQLRTLKAQQALLDERSTSLKSEMLDLVTCCKLSQLAAVCDTPLSVCLSACICLSVCVCLSVCLPVSVSLVKLWISVVQLLKIL